MNIKHPQTNNKPGFTLIELLVVIAIIGILATIATIGLSSVRAKARDSQRVADIKQTQTALEMFYNDNNRYPSASEWASGVLATTTAYGTTTYMAHIPVAANPPDGSCYLTNSFVYTPDTAGRSYQISFCTGGQVANLNTGNKCATPDGILNVDCSNSGNFTDIRDGQVYPWIKIGEQTWMAKNLNVGTMIPNGNSAPGCIDVSGSYEWANFSCQTSTSAIEKYCSGNNPSQCNIYGGLYEWAETLGLPYQCNWRSYDCDSDPNTCTELINEYYAGGGDNCTFPNPEVTPRQGICPNGWHVPSNSDWQALVNYLSVDGHGGAGDLNDVGGKLKEGGTTHWDIESCDDGQTPAATCNSSKFNALPAGYRTFYGNFADPGAYNYLWLSTPSYYDQDENNYFVIYYGPYIMSGTMSYRTYGMSVRCLKN